MVGRGILGTVGEGHTGNCGGGTYWELWGRGVLVVFKRVK